MKKNFFVLAAVIISNQLSAQDSTGHLLEEAVITAHKFPNKTSLTGKVVTIITKEQLDRSGGRDLAQVLNEQAGLYIGGANSNAGKDKSLYLRGGRIDHTLITIDGVPVYDPSGIGGNFDIRNLSLAGIERIEILKGSQSTLYGSDAINGVINIITRKASPKKTGGDLGISYGSNHTFRGQAGINGRSGKIDYHAASNIHSTRGINEAVDKGIYPETDKDRYRQQQGQMGLGIRATDKWQVQTWARYASVKGDIDQGAFTDELDYSYHQKSWQSGLRNELDWGTKKLTLLYNYNHIDRVYTDDSTRSRNGYDTWTEGRYKGHEHFADAYLVAPLGKNLKLTAGLDFRNSVSDQDYHSIGFFGPYDTKYSSDSLKQTQFGIYSALQWNHSSGFNAELGGRMNFHSEYGSHSVFNINPSYLLNKKVKLFTNLSSAFRTPSLYQLFSEYGNRGLKPESALTFEGGIQYYAPGNKFTARAVGFSRRVKDLVYFYYNPTTFSSQYINQDRQKDQGLELETAFTPVKGTTLRVYYTYVTGKIRTKQSGKDTTYNNLLRRPRNTVGINLGSQLTPSLYVSSNILAAGKRKDAYFDNTTFSSVHLTLDSYLLWDIYLEYRFLKNKLRVYADLRNINGARYTEISGFNTLGFNGYGGIRYQF